MFVLFVVRLVLVSGPITTDVKDVKESLGLRLIAVRIISVSSGDGRLGKGFFREKSEASPNPEA